MGSGFKVDIIGTLGKYGYSNLPESISDEILSVIIDHAHYTAIKKAPYDKKNLDDVHLREHIQKDIDLKNHVGYVFVKISDIPYAAVVEYGTKHRWAVPFMKPAAMAARSKMKAIIRKSTKDAIVKEKPV
jgi:hypothetical protein